MWSNSEPRGVSNGACTSSVSNAEIENDQLDLDAEIAKDLTFEMKQAILPWNNTLKLPNEAVACERAGISDRSAAMISTAVLEDVCIVSKGSTYIWI